MASVPQPVSLLSFTNFGDLLRYLRRRERLTQLELSIAVGYSEAQISRLEKNQRLPDLSGLKALFIPALHLEKDPESAARLLQLAESARQADMPAPGIAPYKGLLFFDEADAEWFFGREALTSHLVKRVNALCAGNSPRLLAIVGASGSGKSSVVRAGLATALKAAGWDLRVFTPTEQPLKMLESNLLSLGTNTNGERAGLVVDQFEEVFTLCRDETARAEFVERLLFSATQSLPSSPGSAEVKSLAHESGGGVTVVIALRADFYSHCAQFPRLRHAIAGQQEYIGQMSSSELRLAIEEPAKRGGWEFEPGLVDMMLRDIGADSAQDQEPGALPLLSHALLATSERRRGRTFTFEGYHAVGGVRGAIAETAESVFTDKFNQQQQQLARGIFLRLTELGEGTEDTRRRAALTELVPHAEVAAELRAVLNVLADARLVSIGEDSAEVAHEALIREWQHLREWLNEDREGLRLHRHLTEAAHDWEILQRDPGQLYRGARLSQAREWTAANPGALNTQEREFLDASIEHREHEARERERQRQRELDAAQNLAQEQKRRAEEQTRAAKQLRRRAYFLASAVVLTVVLAGIALALGDRANQNAITAEQNAQAAGKARDEAQFQQRLANARAFTAYSLNNLTVDPQLGILLALQAIKATEADRSVLPEAEDALHRAVFASHIQAVLPQSWGIHRAIYSPDERRIATRGNKDFRVWDAKTHQELLNIPVTTRDIVTNIAFGSDGTQVATLDHDAGAESSAMLFKLFNAGTGSLVRQTRLKPDWNQLWQNDFSKDLSRVVILNSDNSAGVWDTTTGEALFTFSMNASSAKFSPDDKHIAVGGWDSALQIMDASNGKVIVALDCQCGWVNGIAFSPDGTRVATAGQGGQVKIWDAEDGKLLGELLGHSNWVVGIAWSPNGKRIASGGYDNKVIVWNLETSKPIYELRGHRAAVHDTKFSPDGNELVTASQDGTAMVWDVSPARKQIGMTELGGVFTAPRNDDRTRMLIATADSGYKIIQPDTLQEGPLITDAAVEADASRVALSPDGNLAGFAAGNQVHIWDLQTGKQIRSLSSGEDLATRGVAFSPNGKWIAGLQSRATGSVTFDNLLTIWDLETGQVTNRIQIDTTDDYVNQVVAWSPDSNHLLTTVPVGNAHIWDAKTGKQMHDFAGHNQWILTFAFSPDGKQLATAGLDATGIVRDAESGTEMYRLGGHTAKINAIDFSLNGKYIVTASADGTAKVWDASNGKELFSFYNGSDPVTGAMFTPDGKHIITSSQDGVIRVYTLDAQELIEWAKSRLVRTWRTDECQKYLHMDKCPPP